jgi:hypothetical protein
MLCILVTSEMKDTTMPDAFAAKVGEADEW